MRDVVDPFLLLPPLSARVSCRISTDFDDGVFNGILGLAFPVIAVRLRY